MATYGQQTVNISAMEINIVTITSSSGTIYTCSGNTVAYIIHTNVALSVVHPSSSTGSFGVTDGADPFSGGFDSGGVRLPPKDYRLVAGDSITGTGATCKIIELKST